jgi:hypothetical protein
MRKALQRWVKLRSNCSIGSRPLYPDSGSEVRRVFNQSGSIARRASADLLGIQRALDHQGLGDSKNRRAIYSVSAVAEAKRQISIDRNFACSPSGSLDSQRYALNQRGGNPWSGLSSNQVAQGLRRHRTMSIWCGVEMAQSDL